jgi:hypothetical protein
MTDGSGSKDVEFLFPITIAPLDNTPPNVDTNTGLTVSKGETAVISSWFLNSADIDSESSDIWYYLEEPLSSEGEFILIVYEEPEEEGWDMREDGRGEKRVLVWNQDNIDNMELYYRHNGPHSTSIVMDHNLFTVQDSSDPPNRSDVEDFIVKILPVDDIAPHQNEGTTLQFSKEPYNFMNVREFELTAFNRDLLRYTDEDTDDKELSYRITGEIKELNPIDPLQDTGTICFKSNHHL